VAGWPVGRLAGWLVGEVTRTKSQTAESGFFPSLLAFWGRIFPSFVIHSGSEPLFPRLAHTHPHAHPQPQPQPQPHMRAAKSVFCQPTLAEIFQRSFSHVSVSASKGATGPMCVRRKALLGCNATYTLPAQKRRVRAEWNEEAAKSQAGYP